MESYKINNTVLNFNKVVYIDVANGNDASGNGSKSLPFKSVKKAMDCLNSNADSKISGAIIFKEGTYNIDACVMGASYNMNAEYNGMKVSWIAANGDQGKVIVSCNRGFETLIVENNKSYRIKLCFYRLIFKDIKNNSNRMCLGGDDWTNEYYNCVFNSIGLGGWNGLVKNTNVIMSNCLLLNTSEAHKDSRVSGKCINNATSNTCMPINAENVTCLKNVKVDADYTITSDGWKNAGTGKNPDGTAANIGVYGGEFAWKNPKMIFDIDPDVQDAIIGDEVTVNLTLNNVTEIAGEDVRIKYDDSKLKFIGREEVNGIKLAKNIENGNELRVMLASKGKENVVNSLTVLLKIKFKAVATGSALVDVVRGRISDGKTMEEDVLGELCGQGIVNIIKEADVDKDGEYTLLDLAIVGRHSGEEPSTLPNYNADTNKDGKINEDDLSYVSGKILENNNYSFNK